MSPIRANIYEFATHRCARPGLAKDDDALFPVTAEGWRLRASTPEQRYAWARGLSLMREEMTEKTQARIVIGGKLKGFLGVIPGVIEEAWMSLVKGKPMFLIGAFGGCARAVADQLVGIARLEFKTDHTAKTVPDYAAAVKHYADDGVTFVNVEQMGEDIARRGEQGLANALANGLDDAENLELIRCSDPMRIAELILQGLSRF